MTIGRPLEGYWVYVLDPELRPVRPGDPGEICIGGIGVARGYAGAPELTDTRFVPDPCSAPGEIAPRIYRTGDRGRLDREGKLRFLGRADGQVKLRGFRVELEEIESALKGDEVLAAACAVREEVPGLRQVVGYVVPRPESRIDPAKIRSRLRDRLPSYMVPAVIETMEDLPRLPSGKLDRAALPAPGALRARSEPPAVPPRTDTERRIAELWAPFFRPLAISVEADFFLDLGGHSLLAARVVSAMRRQRRFRTVSVSDIYHHSTVAALAAALDAAPGRPGGPRPVEKSDGPAPGDDPGVPGRHFRAGLFQLGGLYFLFGFRALQWITPYLIYFALLARDYPVRLALAGAAAATVAVFPALLLAAVAAKWLLLGRVRPGRHPLWGGYHLRWWLVHGLVSSLHLDLLRGTPLMPMVFRWFGARVGPDVHLDTSTIGAFDLLSIEEGASVDEGRLLGHSIRDGELVLGPVQVGRGCFVGTGAVLAEHTVMESQSRLEDLSLLPPGGRVPRGETWEGSPAAPAAVRGGPAVSRRPAPARKAATAILYAALALALPLVPLIAFLPGISVLSRIDPLLQPLRYLIAVPLVGASFVVLLTLGVVLLKWLLVGRVRAGTYPVHGGFYIRKWIVDQLMARSLDVVGSLHATLYLAPWYRALGARIGRFVELSTATSATPDLLEIADGGTVADEVSLGAPRVEGGWMTLAPTRLGRRAFAGNGAVISPGIELGDESLVGVLSISPPPGDAVRPGASWLGSPPLRLPRRQRSAAFSEGRTYRPSRMLWLTRGAVEILRVTLPPAGFIVVTTTLLTGLFALMPSVGVAGALLALPVLFAACALLVALGVALAKWSIIGRYRPFERPLWSLFVWRLELVNALYEFLAAPLALAALQGTPFLPWYLRLLGARIGRGTCLETTGFLEWDLVEIGDQTSVGDNAVLQTHLFEDRVLKASRVRLGPRCSVGAVSVVLYDTKLEEGVRLLPLSLVMKGETLPAGTAWAGSPAESATPGTPRRGSVDHGYPLDRAV